MKKLLTIALAAVIGLGVYTGTASAKAPKASSVTGVFDGYADPTSFEIKTKDGYMYFTSYNHWYRTHLIEGRTYKFFYSTSKYGQNFIVQIWK